MRICASGASDGTSPQEITPALEDAIEYRLNVSHRFLAVTSQPPTPVVVDPFILLGDSDSSL
jgi:hypothetical protein